MTFYRFLLPCLLLLLCSCFGKTYTFSSELLTAQAAAQTRADYQSSFEGQVKYARDVHKFNPKHYTKLCFIGDSITEGWFRSDIYALWQKYFKPLDAVNYGISGDKTQNVLYRMDNGIFFQGFNPRVFVVMIGINNLRNGDTPEATLAGIEAIICKIRNRYAQSQIIVSSVLPSTNNTSLEKINALNEALPELCARYNADYFEVYKRFVNADGSLNADYFLADKLHLSHAGYDRYAIALRAFFEATAKK